MTRDGGWVALDHTRPSSVPLPFVVSREGTNVMRILLIEDEVPDRESLTRVLSRNGYTVLTAGDGKAGLALLSRHRFRLVT